ncbi:SagB/ThcOx family dehydrogenase [bacterium]|nr:SagB/ThcOx family dehydrogenase [bacterium]
MKKEPDFNYIFPFTIFILFFLTAIFTGGYVMADDETLETPAYESSVVNLPDPVYESDISLEETLRARRSMREYSDRPLDLLQVSQLLWAAQGITADWGARTAPSAGGLFPVRIYFVAGDVEGLTQGSWEYDPISNTLTIVKEGDMRRDLMAAALGQGPVGNAPATIVISAIPEITEAKYGDRSMRYIDQEVGAVLQNIYLQCETLGLGTVAIGAFYDDQVAEVVGTSATVRLIMPVGVVED